MQLRGQPGGGGIGERNNSFFNNGREKIKHDEVGAGKIFCILIDIRVINSGLHGGRLLRGGDHEGLDQLAVKQRLGGIRGGGIIPGDVEGSIELAIITNPGTFEGTSPSTEITGFVETIACNGGRPTVGTGNGGNKRTKRNRSQISRHDHDVDSTPVVLRLKNVRKVHTCLCRDRGGAEMLPRESTQHNSMMTILGIGYQVGF